MSIEDNTEDRLELDLGDDPKPAEDIIVEKSEEKSSADPVQDTLEALKQQLEEERRGRQEAMRRASEAEQTAYAAQGEVQDTSLHLVSNAIDTVRQNNNILKANYREAMSSGDYDTAADIQAEMSANAAKLLQLEQGKQALETQPRQPAPKPYEADPVEALASQLSPRSADWVRRNPQYATDPRLYQKMIAAHNLAMADDIPADSDDYFEAIEDTLRMRRQDNSRDYDAMADAAKPTQRRSAPPAAPVSRSGGGGGSKPNRVTLSAAEREMASMMGMTPEEYGRNKLTLQKEGKLN
jgi:molybdopterin converting factor small subunit